MSSTRPGENQRLCGGGPAVTTQRGVCCAPGPEMGAPASPDSGSRELRWEQEGHTSYVSADRLPFQHNGRAPRTPTSDQRLTTPTGCGTGSERGSRSHTLPQRAGDVTPACATSRRRRHAGDRKWEYSHHRRRRRPHRTSWPLLFLGSWFSRTPLAVSVSSPGSFPPLGRSPCPVTSLLAARVPSGATVSPGAASPGGRQSPLPHGEPDLGAPQTDWPPSSPLQETHAVRACGHRAS